MSLLDSLLDDGVSQKRDATMLLIAALLEELLAKPPASQPGEDPEVRTAPRHQPLT